MQRTGRNVNLNGDGSILRLADVSVDIATARGVVRVVDHVDLALRPGCTLGVVGESGSGKSMLLRAILGLHPDNVEVSGSVQYRGQELVGAPIGLRRQLWANEMAVVFQDPMTSLNPVQRIGNQVEEPLVVHTTMNRRERRRRVDELLEQLGIVDPPRCRRSYPHQLSGGMRQRIAIAIALIRDPSVVLADEPTTALDVTVQAQILELLARQRRSSELAMVIVSHDLGVIADIADDVAVMYAGQLVEHGSAHTLLERPRMRYTAALLASRPSLTGDRGRRLDTIAGRPPSPSETSSGCRFAPRCRHGDEACEAVPALTVLPGDEHHRVRCWHPISTTGAENE